MFLDRRDDELIAACRQRGLHRLSQEQIARAAIILNAGSPALALRQPYNAEAIHAIYDDQRRSLSAIECRFCELRTRKSDLAALAYVVENLAAIRSLYMLDSLFSMWEQEPSCRTGRWSNAHILTKQHYDAITACTEGNDAGLAEDDIVLIRTILNLATQGGAGQHLDRRHHIDQIQAAVEGQNRIMTPIGAALVTLQEEQPGLAAYIYALENLDAIRSIWMLDILVGLMSDPQRSRQAAC